MSRNQIARTAATIFAVTMILATAANGATIYPENYSFEDDDTTTGNYPGDVEGAQYPSSWTFYCPQDDFVNNYGQYVDIINQSLEASTNPMWPSISGISGNQFLWMFGGGVSPQITQILTDTVKAGYGYELQVDFATPFGAPSGISTITLSAGGPVTYPTLSDPSNITSPMVLTSGGGMAIAARTIGGSGPTGDFTAFSTGIALASPSLAGKPLTASIAVDPDGSTGKGNDDWFIDNVQIQEVMPGDANGDGKVDVNDLTIVLSNFGQSGQTWATGDFNGDGRVDVNDLTIVLSNFGATSGAGIAPVPEPGIFALSAAGLASLLAYASAWSSSAARARQKLALCHFRVKTHA